jgi:Tfp pilus assembly protein PilO
MTQTNIKVILVLLSVLALGGVYMYIFKGNMDDKKSIEAETETLETRLADLRAKEVNRDEYLAETDEYYAAVEDIIADYPATLDQELTVMFFKGIAEKYEDQFDVSSIGLGTPSLFYTLGDSGYNCYSAAFPISYTGGYESVQDFLQYIADYQYRMNIDTISISYDSENDVCSGSINLDAYCVSGEDREADTVDVDVPTGVENLFIGGEGAAKNTNYAYDDDEGASIATSNDIKVTIVNANNDAGDGIIVSGGDEDVTSAENSVEKLELSIYEEDGKTYAKYAIGDDESTVEITGSDVKIYVSSSDRVDTDDKNGVKLTVDNKTSLPVFVKVDGDDDAGRFTLGSKSGTVKVY